MLQPANISRSDTVICLIGDTQNILLNKHEILAIKRGLINAAQVTGALILCSEELGMSNFIKDAISRYPQTDDATQVTVQILRNSDIGIEKYLLEDKDFHAFTICIVIGGKLEMIRTIIHIANNIDDIQIIVIEGSGRAPDFLSHVYKNTIDSALNENIAKNVLESQVEDMSFDGVNDDTLNFYYQQCQMMTDKIKLWSAEGENGLDFLIENSLFSVYQAKNVDVQTRIATSAAWNRYDLAEKAILREITLPDFDRIDYKKCLIDGLINNKVRFVIKVLKQLDDFESLLTRKELYDIYKQSCYADGNDRAADFFIKLFFRTEIVWPEEENTFFFEVGQFIENLLGDAYLNPYREDSESSFKKVSAKDLFCWAILLNRCEMATLFWSRGDNYICASLFASALLQELSKCAENFGDIDLSYHMKNNAMLFEHFASTIINRMHIRKGVIAKQLIVSTVEQYGKTTPLYIAGNNNLMNFMEQTACQAKLTEIWNGNMAWNTSIIKKFWCIFLPFLLLPTVAFKSPKYGNLRLKTHPEASNKMCRYYKILSSEKEGKLGFVEAVSSFYSAPVIKFIASVTCYAVFLMTFSIMIMTDLHDLEDGGVSLLEMVVIFWAVTFILEDLRQVVEEDQPSAWSKMKLWFSSIGNKFELAANLMLLISILVRFLLPTGMFRWARYSYSITAVLYWWISMRFYFVHRHIGPKVVMIGKMLTDLVFIIMIFVVVVISAGIAYTANIYPNSIFNWATVKKIVFYPYWQMHGELFLDYLRGREPDPPGECTENPLLYKNGTLPACPVKFDMVSMIAVVYLILLNIILLNVLIAMFSYTFLKVQSRAGKVARFHNYFLVYKYSNMPTLVAPFNLINLLYRIVRHCCRGCRRHNAFKMRLDENNLLEEVFYESEALQATLLRQLVPNDFSVKDLMKFVLNTKENDFGDDSV